MIDYLLETNQETRGFSSGSSATDGFAFRAGYLLCCLTLDLNRIPFGGISSISATKI